MGLLSFLFGTNFTRTRSKPPRGRRRAQPRGPRRAERREALQRLQEELRRLGRGAAHGHREDLVRDLAESHHLPQAVVSRAVTRSGVARPPGKPKSQASRPGALFSADGTPVAQPARSARREAAERQREQLAQQRSELAMVRRYKAARETEIRKLMRGADGYSRQEAEELVDANWEYTRRNPGGLSARLAAALMHLHGGPVRRNPDSLASRAHQMSQAFHGEPNEVRGDQVVLGTLEEVTYRAPRTSQRAGLWTHNFGDFGVPFLHSKRRPLLVADARTGRVGIEQAGSPATFVDRAGIVG